jgi:hypothetical protein
LGYLHYLTNERVVNTTTIKICDEASSENYFHQLLFLFLPWRDEKDILFGQNSYFKAYERAQQLAKDNLISFDIAKLDLFKFRRERTQLAINRIKELHKSVDDESNNNNNTAFGGNAQNLGVADYVLNHVDIAIIEKKISELNNGQLSIFNKIINNIEHYELHRNSSCQCSENNKPLRLFCSGVGGNKIINIFF